MQGLEVSDFRNFFFAITFGILRILMNYIQLNSIKPDPIKPDFSGKSTKCRKFLLKMDEKIAHF